MSSVSIKKHFVQPTIKGQVTLPVTIRRELAIDQNTLLDVTVVNGRVVLAPVNRTSSSKQSPEQWKTIVDFTQFSPEGVPLEAIVNQLESWTKSKKHSKN